MNGGQIVVFGLTKAFGRVRAVNNLSFVAQPGRVTALLGPPAAGKTTTLRMLLGLEAPTMGTATICGFEYRDLTNPASTVGGVLDLSAAAVGPDGPDDGATRLNLACLSARKPFERTAAVLDIVGLSGAADRPLSTYSISEQWRLAVALVLIAEPRVLILDELALGPDPGDDLWLGNLFRRLTASGGTVLFATHCAADARRLADDVVVIEDGCLVVQGAIAAIAWPGGRETSMPEPRVSRG